MAGSSSLASPRSLQLPLLLLFLLVAAAIGSYDPKAFCSKTTDVASCLKVFPTLPDIVTKAQDNQELYKRLVHYCSFKTYEATSLAESMIATTTAANPANIATFFEQWKGDEAITTKTPPGPPSSTRTSPSCSMAATRRHSARVDALTARRQRVRSSSPPSSTIYGACWISWKLSYRNIFLRLGLRRRRYHLPTSLRRRPRPHEQLHMHAVPSIRSTTPQQCSAYTHILTMYLRNN
ncbi:hypothetical protein DAI22_11g061200 [Oryza sativa Japonica Group]|nr:hypothetical protein DAI22_11g061200 [Oryza sativa Japonica Group]